MKKLSKLICGLLSLLLVFVLSAELAEASGVNAPALPFFSNEFQGFDVVLRTLDKSTDRAYSFSGPGKDYLSAGGYLPEKQLRITIFFKSQGWYLAHIVYKTSEERFAWLRKTDFTYVPKEVPELDSLPSWEGITRGSILPAWGPGSKYNRVEFFTVPDGTAIQAFFQENGFIYAEYMITGKKTRMWLPADQVVLKDASATITDETKRPFVISNFGKPSAPKAPSIPADGSWSDWTFVQIDEADDIEVEERTVYRGVFENAEWVDDWWLIGSNQDPFESAKQWRYRRRK